jgi:hypothetical protein
MKKIGVIILAILMVSGFGTVASAAPTLSFDIDFYDGSTALAQGVFDTGSTIRLMPGDTVNVDILFSVTEEGVVGGGFDLDFDSDGINNLTASNLSFPFPPFVDTGESEITAGNVRAQAFAFPPGTAVGPGSDNVLASFVFECTGLGLDDLVLGDFGTGADWVTSPSGIDLDDQVTGTLASINNVPIPGALWLLGSGLIALVGLRRRNQKHQ